MAYKRLHVGIAWITVSFFFFYQYILRVLPSILMSDITTKFAFSAEAFGQFSGIYYIGYSLMHLPVGILLDRVGPKKTLPVFILLTAAGMIPLVFSNFWVYPILGRLVVGMGSSAAALGVFKIIQIFFAENKFSRMLGFSVMIGVMGAIYGGGPVHLVRMAIGYDSLLLILIAVGIALAVLTYFLMPVTQTTGKSESLYQDVMGVLANKELLSLCFFAGLMVGPLEGFADVWGSQFLRTVYGLDQKVAASLPSFVFLGMCLGGPILSFIAETTRKFMGVVVTSAIVMCLCFVLLLFAPLSVWMLTALFLIVGICSAYQVLVIYQVSTFVDRHHSGLATALANMIIMIFGYVFHSAIGQMVSVYSDQSQGGSTATPEGLIAGIATIPAAMGVSVVGLLYCMHQKSKKRLASPSPVALKA